ncbi:MAG: hypothetical protein HY778_13210 [Betaproteobacteria bacterium]|nr:hypothetical protein [Betaproteobacteria bacterium]
MLVLVGLAKATVPELGGLADGAVILTPYATLFRYPDVVMEPGDEDVFEALTLAQSFLEAVSRCLERRA